MSVDSKFKTKQRNENSELQAILSQQADAGLCLLRDSPYRILRVSSTTYTFKLIWLTFIINK